LPYMFERALLMPIKGLLYMFDKALYDCFSANRIIYLKEQTNNGESVHFIASPSWIS